MEKKEVFVDVSARHVHLSREDQDVLFCAMDHPDEILIRSLKAPFEIREAGFGRDEGAVLYEAVIRKDILYYIILESKHEISVRASMGM